jgi:hypothetical protein
MRHTLVAAFATLTDANRTRGDLMARGIPREQIHAVGADSADIHAYDEPYSTTDSTVDRTHHDSKITHFFKSLFGHESHDEHRYYAAGYHEAVRRGSLVIAVDVNDDDEMVRARDALEYNGAISIDEDGTGGAGTTQGYAEPTSPYAGATGGDSHLDKHFTAPSASATSATHPIASERPVTAAPVAPAPGTGFAAEPATTAKADHSADTGAYDIGSAAKRAGTDYPETTATTAPTGAGTTGHGSSTETPLVTAADLAAAQPSSTAAIAPTSASSTGHGSSAGSTEAATETGLGPKGLCGERVCVIRRPD